MSPDDVHTILDFITYCRKALAERPEYLREKEQEPIAAGVVGACLQDRHEEWEKYPQFVEIFDIAANLEISNVANTSQSWRRIKQLVDELEQVVTVQK